MNKLARAFEDRITWEYWKGFLSGVAVVLISYLIARLIDG